MKINCELKGIKKKIFVGLAVVMALAMTSGSFALSDVLTPASPSQSEATETLNGTSSIMGDFNVTGDTSGCSFKSSILTIKSGSPTISMAPGKSSTSQRIKVEGGSTITLAGVNIKVSDGGGLMDNSPFGIKDEASFDVTILLADGTTNILDGNEAGYNYCSGLKKSNYKKNGKLVIDAAGPAGNGKLIAYGGQQAPGIGVQSMGGAGVSNITITGGIIEAYGGRESAGIGAASNCDEENIVIEGGIVTAVGKGSSAGIGCGDHRSGKNNAISGNAVVFATSGKSGASPLEGFSYSQGIAFTRQTTSGGWSGAMYGSVRLNQSVQFPANLTVGGGQTLALSEGKSLTMASGAALYVGSGGTLVNDGTLPEDNSVVCQAGGTIKTQLVFYGKDGDPSVRAGSNEDTIYKSSGVVQKYQYPALIDLPVGAEGWYTESDGHGSHITTNENVQLNLHNLYAYYQCVVKFDTGVSTISVDDQYVGYKAKAEDPGMQPIAVIDGKKKYIEGWYKEASCTNKWDFNTDIVSPTSGNEITLYAKWVDCPKVTFDLQGGTAADGAADEQDLRGGDFVTEPDPSKITRDGYTFKDWYTNPDGTGVSYDFAHTPVTQDLTLYAVWLANAYNINVTQPEHGHIEYPWTGDMDEEIHFTVNAVDKGWQVKDGSISVVKTASGEPIDFEPTGQDDTYKFIMPDEDVTISASMEKITYTVTFDTQNGDATTTVPAQYGDTVTKPADPTYDGHVFDNWYTNSSGEGAAYDFNTPITGDLTIYANWFTIHNINLNKTGYGQINFNQTESIKGQTITFKMTPDIGWEISGLPTFTPEGESAIPVTREQQVNTYSFVMPDKNVTVNVVFKITTHTVTFHTQVDGVPAPETQTIDYGSYATKPTDPTREKFQLVGWYTKANPDETDKAYDFEKTAVTADVDLYAQWVQVAFDITSTDPTHGHIDHVDYAEQNTTVKFKVEGTDEGWQVKNGSVTVTTASGTNVPVTKVTANSDGEEDDYTFTMPSENVTITAEMEKITYTVTFKSQNGVSDITVPVKYGDTVSKPEDPTFAGHKFNGWYDNNQGDGDAYNFATPISGDLTLYANWLTIYNVGLNKEGNGNVSFNQTQAVKGDTITFTLTPETGWYISGFPTFTPEGGQPEHVTLDIQNPNTYKFTMPDKAVTVNVVFRISTHMVRFYSQAEDVQPPSTQVVKYGEYATEPEDPVRPNYQFVGWYTNPEGTGETFDFDCAPVTENISLYAVWTQNAYPIIWQQPEHGDIQSVKAAVAYTDVKFRVHALNEDKETYELSNITLTAADGTEVKFDKVVSNGIGDDDDLYHFTMPNSAVTISAAFEPIPDPGPGPEPTPDSSVVPGQGGGSNGNGASSKTGDAFAGGVALAILGVASTGAVLLRKRK